MNYELILKLQEKLESIDDNFINIPKVSFDFLNNLADSDPLSIYEGLEIEIPKEVLRLLISEALINLQRIEEED